MNKTNKELTLREVRDEVDLQHNNFNDLANRAGTYATNLPKDYWARLEQADRDLNYWLWCAAEKQKADTMYFTDRVVHEHKKNLMLRTKGGERMRFFHDGELWDFTAEAGETAHVQYSATKNDLEKLELTTHFIDKELDLMVVFEDIYISHDDACIKEGFSAYISDEVMVYPTTVSEPTYLVNQKMFLETVEGVIHKEIIRIRDCAGGYLKGGKAYTVGEEVVFTVPSNIIPETWPKQLEVDGFVFDIVDSQITLVPILQPEKLSRAVFRLTLNVVDHQALKERSCA